MPASFRAARPIWLTGRHTEMNLTAGFRHVFTPAAPPTSAVLRLAARTTYRAWLNGQIFAIGPARAAHGHARIDQWPLASLLRPGPNLLAIEVTAANVPAYAHTDEHPFLQAELLIDGTVLAATGTEATAFDALIPGERVQRVQRLSRQRAFAEAYRLTPHSADWRTQFDATFATHPTELVAQPTLLPRRVPYPRLDCLTPICALSTGTLALADTPDFLPGEKWLVENCGNALAGYPNTQWDVHLSAEVARLRSHPDASAPAPAVASFTLAANSYRILDLAVNRTGFLRARVRCTAPAILYLTGDEFLTDNDVNCRRLEYFAGVRYELAPGDYDLETDEPITLRYLKALVLTGRVEIEHLGLREYARPTAAEFASSDPVLDRLFAAADRTFSQNAPDLYMDCPSRERAGWLCDSFFTARVEPWLTGTSLVETAFLENFALAPDLPDYPPGMFPKCYPADGLPSRNFPPGSLSNYIPNWGLWLILQLAEYADRATDPATASIIAAFEPKTDKLFAFFQKYQNAAGLLERLDKWVFIDWSDANKHTQDVNYPTNMLYAAALDAAGRLYRREAWRTQAAAIRQQVLRQSFTGTYFIDNATRTDGRLVPTANHTEACQYYAFYFGIATPDSHPELWHTLLTRCSLAPDVAHPDLPRAGALPAHHLRMRLLARYGHTQQLLDEIRACFTRQADLTGTFWEHDTPKASCNHAFASHVAHLLLQEILGLTVTWKTRTLTLRIPKVDLTWCRARLPLDTGPAEIAWHAGTPQIARIPEGWTLIPPPNAP